MEIPLIEIDAYGVRVEIILIAEAIDRAVLEARPQRLPIDVFTVRTALLFFEFFAEL